MFDIERLKRAKKEKGFSYDELAQLTGLSRSTITNIFCGYIDLPRHYTIQAIERALGLIDTPASLSDDERALLNLFAEAEEKLGKAYVQGVKQMVRVAIETKP